jgi:chaperone required for assembly of F1-ATPase
MTNETEDQRWQRLLRDHTPRVFPKRFYKSVTVSHTREILLDGRPVKTPLKASLVLPTSSLAEAVAMEWSAQVDVIIPFKMPLTKLANTAIDQAPRERPAIVEELLAYANSDLLCYRAAEPEALVARQALHWDPQLEWAKVQLGAFLNVTSGIGHVSQSPEFLAACRHRISPVSNFHLVALHTLVTLSGSAILGLMVMEGSLTPETAWSASNLDEDWQNEQWGEDFEAKTRREARWAEFSAAARFLNLAENAS